MCWLEQKERVAPFALSKRMRCYSYLLSGGLSHSLSLPGGMTNLPFGQWHWEERVDCHAARTTFICKACVSLSLVRSTHTRGSHFLCKWDFTCNNKHLIAWGLRSEPGLLMQTHAVIGESAHRAPADDASGAAVCRTYRGEREEKSFWSINGSLYHPQVSKPREGWWGMQESMGSGREWCVWIKSTFQLDTCARALRIFASMIHSRYYYD